MGRPRPCSLRAGGSLLGLLAAATLILAAPAAGMQHAYENLERTCSVSTCTDLGWGRYDNSGQYFDLWPASDPDICGETDFPMEGCSGTIDWAEAFHRCDLVGARLCTLSELQADEARGTGCRYDEVQIWSSDSCGAGSYSTGLGGSNFGVTTTCTAATDTTVAFLRCCADAYGCSKKPTQVPTYLPTLMPSSLPTLPPSPAPTQMPTLLPSPAPTPFPTPVPSPSPTFEPTATFSPTTWEPSATPSHPPTYIPTHAPSQVPSPAPSVQPAPVPTATPTLGTITKCDFTHQYLCPSGCSKFTVECNEVSKYAVDAGVDVFDYDDSAF